jgi:FMN phosphatase YigB (HAD superfamily)
MVFSEEIGVRKPDAKIFHYTTRKLRAKPEETVHVGDNLKMDVWGAKCAGLRAIHFSSEEGRDKLAESDPNSLVSLSRRLGDTKKDEILPDKVVYSLSMVVAAIEELESRQNHYE